MRKNKRQPRNMPVLRPNAAGIDISATEIVAAVPQGRDPKNEDVRSFEAFTQDLYRLAAWLRQCRIDTVAMESTGVYWIPVFQILESEGLEVYLVNANHVKNVDGRKTDVLDCQWIQFLHSVGLLQGSYRPPQDVCAIRTILRHRDGLVKSSAHHIRRMQKSLDQMNLKLHHVISDITGVSGLRIIEAVLQGERDPKALAALCHKRIRAKEDVVAKSLVGDYLPEHLFTLNQSLEAYRHYRRLIEETDREIERLLRKFQSRNAMSPQPSQTDQDGSQPRGQSYELKRIFGVDLTKVPALGIDTLHTLFGEVGPDLTKFRSAAAFASWLTLSPNNKISGGKVLSQRTRKTKSRTAIALRIAAQSLHNNKSWLGSFFRRMRAKLGGPKAITATAHRLARLIYHLVTTGQEYDESRLREFEIRDQQRRLRRLRANAQALGYELLPVPKTT